MKKKIRNTSDTDKSNLLLNLIASMGINGEGIIEQERNGQLELVNKSNDNISQLPSSFGGYGNDKEKVKEMYESLGFEVIGLTEGDEIWYDVIMPEGWRVERTNHNMWNKLIDPKGYTRTMIFYKAAFYDRSCHIRELSTRYNVREVYVKDKDYSLKWYELVNQTPIQYKVIDYDDVSVFRTKATYYTRTYVEHERSEFNKGEQDMKDAHEQLCIDHLNEHYPDWENPMAYWD